MKKFIFKISKFLICIPLFYLLMMGSGLTDVLNFKIAVILALIYSVLGDIYDVLVEINSKLTKKE